MDMVEHPELLNKELLSALSLCQRERENEGAQLDIYSTIFGADEEKSESLNRASGDGRKLMVREVTLPFSAIPDGQAPASLGQEEIIVLNTFFTAAHPVTEGHTGDFLKFSVCKPKPRGYCKKDEKADFPHCSVPRVLWLG